MPYQPKHCPVNTYVNPLHSQWGMPLLAELSTGNKRFLELKTALAPITNKTLSNVLTLAQERQCVTKNEDKYELTTEGKQLFKTLKSLTNNTCETCTGKTTCLKH